MAVDDVATGRAEGLTSSEKAELAELRRRNRVLEMEVEVLKRASAYFARENILQNVMVVDRKHWAGPVEVRNGRLCLRGEPARCRGGPATTRSGGGRAAPRSRHGAGWQPVGLSAVHVVPILAFTSFSGARRADARVGLIRLMAVPQLE